MWSLDVSKLNLDDSLFSFRQPSSLRYSPYKVPHIIVRALQRYRHVKCLPNGHSNASEPSISSKLSNIRLNGCDFGGQPLKPSLGSFFFHK